MKRAYILLTFLIAFLIAIAENPEIDRLLQEGIELHSAGEFQSAIEKYNAVLQIDPENISAIYEIALSYLALGNYENAIIYTTKVINSRDRALSIGAYAIQSEALAALDKTNEAIALLERALEIKGSEYLLHFNLALNFYKLNDLENTLLHVKKAIDLDKSHAEAFLLYAYVLNDMELWVQSIFAFQMFLLLEPDDHRARTAFGELLQTMRIASLDEDEARHPFPTNPPLTIINGINRFQIYNTINATLRSLRENSEEENNLFLEFKSVNRDIVLLLNEKNDGSEDRTGIFWTFYVPFFTRIVESEHYETFARYISVSYFPESFEWWQEHPEDAELFVIWFEEGDVEYDHHEHYKYPYDPDDNELGNEAPNSQHSISERVITQQNRTNFFQRLTSNFRSQPMEENITGEFVEYENTVIPIDFQDPVNDDATIQKYSIPYHTENEINEEEKVEETEEDRSEWWRIWR